MIKAAIRADKLLGQGDVDGAFVWERIMRAIDRLQVTTPVDGQLVH